MTKVSYTLTNGKEVSSLKEAQMSGMGYKISYTPIPRPEPQMTEKRKEMRVKI